MNDLIRALTGTREHPVLTFRRSYRATPAQVRDAVTDPERLVRWFGQVRGNPAAVGDHFTAHLSEDPDDVARGTVLGCDEDTIAVSWSWQNEPRSTITARIAPVDDQNTELRLQHALDQPDHTAGYGGGWEQMLQALARALGAAGHGAPAEEDIESRAIARWHTLSGTALAIDHHVQAPPEAVWEALATAEGLRSWWWRHWDDVQIRADVRPGGTYDITAPGAGIALSGTYLAVEPGTHLAFTWQWHDDDGTSADEAVDLRLQPESGGTRIVLRHTGPWLDERPAASYRQGWEFVLAELTSVLTGPGR